MRRGKPCGTLRSVDRDAFEVLVRTALDELPDEFLRYLDNVEVVVEDEPDPALLRSLGLNPRRATLFGLYQGVPLDERGALFGNALPDKISIYAGPLCRACRSPEQLREQVRRTVVHEVGHFFGLDDEAIRKLGY